MKLIEKKYINEYERLISILGIKIHYSKTRDNNKKRIKYNVKIGNFSFNMYKNKSNHKKSNPLKFDKQKQLLTLIFLKCLKNFFAKNNEAETLVLGSSTARGSFIEDEKSINMAIDGQDLYYTYQLFKKFSYQIPNLKNIVIYFDVFSSGNDLDYSPVLPHVNVFYKAFFDIPYKNKLIPIKNNTIKLECELYKQIKYINENIPNLPNDIMPILHGGLQTESELKDLAGAESKLANRGTMLKYLDILLKEAKDLNTFIVIAPRNPLASSTYPPHEELFEDLYKLIEKHNNNKIKVLNCFNSIEKEGFVDLLHLNLKGAKKVTEIIKNNLQSVNEYAVTKN